MATEISRINSVLANPAPTKVIHIDALDAAVTADPLARSYTAPAVDKDYSTTTVSLGIRHSGVVLVPRNNTGRAVRFVFQTPSSDSDQMGKIRICSEGLADERKTGTSVSGATPNAFQIVLDTTAATHSIRGGGALDEVGSPTAGRAIYADWDHRRGTDIAIQSGVDNGENWNVVAATAQSSASDGSVTNDWTREPAAGLPD